MNTPSYRVVKIEIVQAIGFDLPQTIAVRVPCSGRGGTYIAPDLVDAVSASLARRVRLLSPMTSIVAHACVTNAIRGLFHLGGNSQKSTIYRTESGRDGGSLLWSPVRVG